MSIRLKLLIPVIALIGSVLVYASYIWLPHTISLSIQHSERHIHKTLETVAEGLVPFLQESRLDDVYQNLNSLSSKNPEWLYLALSDSEGRSLYPLKETVFSEYP